MSFSIKLITGPFIEKNVFTSDTDTWMVSIWGLKVKSIHIYFKLLRGMLPVILLTNSIKKEGRNKDIQSE